MKTLFTTVLVVLVAYLIQLPISEYLAMGSARESAADGRLDDARETLTRWKNHWPSFFSNDRSALVERVGVLHFARATDTCQKGNYRSALEDFEQIAAQDYPASVLARSAREEGLCRLQYAVALTTKDQRFDAASEQILRVFATSDKVLHEAAAQRIPILIKHEKDHWTSQNQYARAFKNLADRRLTFGSRMREIAPFFDRVQQELETAVFGLPLGRACQEKNHKPDFQRGPTKERFENVIVQNDTETQLRLILRDLTEAQTSALTISSRDSKKLRLDSADYLVAVYVPGDCRVKPLVASWLINPVAVFRAKFVAQDDGSTKTIEPSVEANAGEFMPVLDQRNRS